ncbi:hypothetical protein CsatA_027001 [Cannabis sativa]
MDLILVQVNLTKKLTGKKFLIVLGNVWEEYSEEWKEVMKPFNSGARGRHVILLEKNDEIDSLEKKTRYFGCVIELFTNNKVSSYNFEAIRLRTFLTLGSRYSKAIISN